MIRYGNSTSDLGPWGLGLLLRGHGSAVARAVLPSLLSTGFFFVFYFSAHLSMEHQLEWRMAEHPYVIGAVVAAFSLLMVFRANHSYGRYWGAANNIFQMLSKWQDAGMAAAAYHYQSSLYDESRPSSILKHPMFREQSKDNSKQQDLYKFETGPIEKKQTSKTARLPSFLGLKLPSRGNEVSVPWLGRKKKNINSSHPLYLNMSDKVSIPPEPRRRDPKYSNIEHEASQDCDIGAPKLNTPSLFLQELCHLISILSAVSMSTLRDDMELGQSHLVEYISGDPLPPEDPDHLPAEIRKKYREDEAVKRYFMFLFGFTRTQKHRTLYNAVRPFGVLGGVSDGECKRIQAARGANAKVSLCSMWLYEFVTRESQCGSTGPIAEVFVSRIHQFVSEGILAYNEARKVAMIPFPSPHAQICSFFVVVLCVLFPTLYLSFSKYIWYGSTMNFFTMLCLTGLHEVARELENPFQNTPNELPLPTIQAQFNEALVTMYAGFHPDCNYEPGVFQSKQGDLRFKDVANSETGQERISFSQVKKKDGSVLYGRILS